MEFHDPPPLANAEDMCALGFVLRLGAQAIVVIGRTFFIGLVCRFLPHQRRVRVSPARFPGLCNLCNEPSGNLGRSVKAIEFLLPIKGFLRF